MSSFRNRVKTSRTFRCSPIIFSTSPDVGNKMALSFRPAAVVRVLLRMNVAVILERSTKGPPDPQERIAETITEIWYRTIYGLATPGRRSRR